MALLSYVVPTHNRVEWVGECLGGLLQQTVKDIEVIAVDDASNDGTSELLQWFADRDTRLKIITNAVQSGGGLSRNFGNALASAPIIGVCDDDDCYPVNRAEDTLEFFAKNPEVPMMTAPYVRINYFAQITEEFVGCEFDEKLFKENGSINYFCHPAAAYYKKDIAEIGGYKAETKEKTDDYQLVEDWIKAGKKIGFAAQNFLCMHRVLPDSMMAKQRGFRPEWAS